MVRGVSRQIDTDRHGYVDATLLLFPTPMPAHQHRVNELLNLLAGRAGLGELHLNDLGICTFQFGSDMQFVIELPPATDELYLMAPLALIPPDTDEAHALFRRSLKANYRGIETGGATLTLHESLNHIVLWRSAHVPSLDGPSFIQMVERFLAAALRLAPLLDKAGGEPAEVTTCDIHANALRDAEALSAPVATGIDADGDGKDDGNGECMRQFMA
ncbi:hypothetical protein DB346_16180 [Verrucomicrobia bacterium LW23]|nr:hypothetical protein DB346_16180 [Verrucomicrobia bacterium LW23]